MIAEQSLSIDGPKSLSKTRVMPETAELLEKVFSKTDIEEQDILHSKCVRMLQN